MKTNYLSKAHFKVGGDTNMHIDSIDVYLTKNPLIHPWKTAYGEDFDIYSVLVSMTSDNDVGWAEACPLFAPTYSPECVWSVYYIIKEFLAPLLINKDFNTPEEVNDALSIYKGNPFAKSGIEMAWWTLEAKRKEVPLHELLGGTYKKIPSGADFGVQDSIDTLIKLIDEAFKSNYPRVKLKVMRGWDIDMLVAVRSTFPKETFHIDCNSSYSLDDLSIFKKIDKLGLAMIEQPFYYNDLIDHAKLARALDTPICLDESLNSVYAAEKALDLKACSYMNIKPGRLGGLSNSIKVIKMCKDSDVGCWVGSMLETAVGAGICIELSSCDNMVYPGDLFPSSHLFYQDISLDEIELSGPGYIFPSNKIGNPYLPDVRILNSRTIEMAHLGQNR